jgi:signal transduction histidine kinase
LIVCNQIIENHGGKLGVKSSAGSGTSVTIKFPMAAEALAETASAKQAQPI